MREEKQITKLGLGSLKIESDSFKILFAQKECELNVGGVEKDQISESDGKYKKISGHDPLPTKIQFHILHSSQRMMNFSTQKKSPTNFSRIL